MTRKVRADVARALRIVARKWARAKRDCRYFVETFVRIEDRDAPDGDIAIPFKLWPKQVEALQAFLDHRLTVVLKARQLGLTWLALAYAVWRMVTRPGYQVIALSKTEDDAKELVRRVRFILRHLPMWMCRPKKDCAPGYVGITWDATTETVTLLHPNGEPSYFRALPASSDAARSLTGNLVLIDEWAFQPYAEEIWSAAYPTINRPTGGQVIGLSTGQIGTLFEEVCRDARLGKNGFHFVFLPWHADPRRTKEWYEATKAAMPNTYRADYPATPEEAFTVGQDAFFSYWDPEIHVPFPADWYPPAHWRIVRVYDPGFVSHACCKWYAISPDGWAVCYREYYPTRVTDQEQAEEIIRLSKAPDGSSERIAYTVGGIDAWTPNKQSGISTQEVFARAGIGMIQAQTDRINGWRRLHEWLRPFIGPDGKPMAMLRFTAACKNTIRTYPALVASKTNPEDIASGQEDHPQDCDRYFVMSRPAPPVSEEEKERRRERRRRMLEPTFGRTGY